MKNTILIYVLMGVLFIVPLVLFNIKKIWVRRPPEPVKFKTGRFVFVTLTSILITVFLASAYHLTLVRRYEISLERLAEKQSEAIVGTITEEEFRSWVIANGTDQVAASLEQVNFPDYGTQASARFQLSNWCIPKYWKDVEGFEQTDIIDDENPVYVMYLLEAGERSDYYAARMVLTDNGWKYDWFGTAGEAFLKAKIMPKNGKWYTVKK